MALAGPAVPAVPAVEPSDLNLPAPTAAESANNPTRTIQYEYTHFYQNRYRRGGLRQESLSNTPFALSMNADNPAFVCSRDSFYLSLVHVARVDRPGSEARFRMCAIQGIAVAPGAAADPVDDAIHGYSILIKNLISTNQQHHAGSVIEFLKIDYASTMSEDRTYYDRSKNNVLALLGDDYDALIACPQIMRGEVLQYLLYIFRNEQRYIASSPRVKKAIAKYVITYSQPNMVNVYNGGMSTRVKVHFFAFILNQTQQFIDSLDISSNQRIENYMISRLNNNASDLSAFLGTDECEYLYPNAAAGAAAFVQAAAAAQAAAQAAAAAAAVAAAAAAAAAAAHPYIIDTAPAAGGGGSQKRILRKIKPKKSIKSIKSIKSKSIKSKSIKSKSYKKKINRKKSHRRYR